MPAYARIFLADWSSLLQAPASLPGLFDWSNDNAVSSTYATWLREIDTDFVFTSNWRICLEAADTYDDMRTGLQPAVRELTDALFYACFWPGPSEADDLPLLTYPDHLPELAASLEPVFKFVYSPAQLRALSHRWPAGLAPQIRQAYPPRAQDCYLPDPESFLFFLSEWHQLLHLPQAHEGLLMSVG